MEETDYLQILKALADIPFGVGKKLLIDFLLGNEQNSSIVKNKLFNKPSFGTLAYGNDELVDLIESLILNGLIRVASVPGNKFWKVLELTQKGIEELKNPELYKRRVAYGFSEVKTQITKTDRLEFDKHKEFLGKYSDEQKKAIISDAKNILCIAGAGSGKTTVLTKRIEFLVSKGISPKDILAITFTRKARQEMISRIEVKGVMIETFNSFCEKVLRLNNSLVYDKEYRILTYRDKLIAISRALSSLNIDMKKAIEIYFSFAQRKSKPQEQLAAILLNDCFFVRDYFKFKSRLVKREEIIEHKQAADLIFGIVNYLEAHMKRNGLRDFADQLSDTITLYEKHPNLIPRFSHIMVDEYQDVNSTQIKFIDMLNPQNLFCVGDPRQSIFGWRGSDIKYILNFNEKYKSNEVITLTNNYRSTQPIVKLINASIKKMHLPDLESKKNGEKDIRLLGFATEDAEHEFVIQTILGSKVKREEIFVLARTNKQLNELSLALNSREIPHIMRNDEKRMVAGKGEVTLATIHAIKGMEAYLVFLIGATSQNFPCKGSEHPVVEMIKVDEYDKEEEERRLFYVALSRAKESLYISFTGKKPTYYITSQMLEIIEGKGFSMPKANDLIARLKKWRLDKANALGVPAYIVMNDTTITELAINHPMTKAELETIHGLGPVKVMRYGDELLNLILGVG